MLAHELKLLDRILLEIVYVAPVEYPGWSECNDLVAKHNPLGKMPTLVLDDPSIAVFDSGTICDYLVSLASENDVEPKTGGNNEWLQKTIHACADGILDAENLVVYETKIRPEHMRYEKWIDGQRLKIFRSLDYLERQAEGGALRLRQPQETARLDEIAVAAAIGFLEIRGVEWRKGRVSLKEWFNNFKTRTCYRETDTTIDVTETEKGVEDILATIKSGPSKSYFGV